MRSCVIFFLKSLECLNFWDNKGARWFFSLAVFFFMSFVWMPVCMFTEYRTFRPLLPHVIIYLFPLLLLCHQSYIWYFSLSVGFFFIFSLSFCLLLSLLTYVSFLLYLYKSFSVSLSLSICFTESAAPFRQSLPLSIRPWQRVGKKEKKSVPLALSVFLLPLTLITLYCGRRAFESPRQTRWMLGSVLKAKAGVLKPKSQRTFF